MTASQSSRRTLFIGTLAAGAVLGCGDAVPTEGLAGADAQAVRIALDDVRSRVMPGLSSRARVLEPRLEALDASLRSRDPAAIKTALAAADIALTTLDHDAAIDDTGDRADLSAVRLLLDQARLIAASQR